MESGYAKFVDYTKMQGFKDMMAAVGRRTREFALRRGIKFVDGARGASYPVHTHGRNHLTRSVLLEGLGNLCWIAEWMYRFGDKRSHYDEIAQDQAMMAVGDALPALPFACVDEVTPRNSEWFTDQVRAADFARGMEEVCDLCSMALTGGESPNYRFLVRAEEPVEDAPVMSFAVNSVLFEPEQNLIEDFMMHAGLSIVAAASSGVHSNGISLIIDRGMKLDGQFMTRLPNGNTYGAEALIPTMSYVALIEAIQGVGIPLRGLLPATGGGVAKLAATDPRPFTYRVHTWWPELPPLIQFLLESGEDLLTCLTTFNMGSGIYLFVEPSHADLLVAVGTQFGYDMLEVGRVEEGERMTIAGPFGNLKLPPPGE